ncbi:MAG: FAD-dependent thymidylate synthase, partial [Candidatus Thermoplasmatota archaeon]
WWGYNYFNNKSILGIYMLVRLIAYTPEPELICAVAAKSCHTAKYPGKLSYNEVKKIIRYVDKPGFYKEPNQKTLSEYIQGDEKVLGEEEGKKIVKHVYALGHHSVLEHACFTFSIEGISRACSHQLVRHRLASYSQQSQRYVSLQKFGVVTPDTIKKNAKAKEIYDKLMSEISNAYSSLISLEIPYEDARYVLPNSAQTNIIVTMNARELLHFFNLRCCEKAQWEIRELANKMLAKVKKVAPTIFAFAGPMCLKGPCPEKDINCYKKKRALIKDEDT